MKDIVRTIMLFVPSVEGISHNEKELASDEDMLAGVDLFTDVLGRVTRGDFVEKPAGAAASAQAPRHKRLRNAPVRPYAGKRSRSGRGIPPWSLR